MNKLLEGLETIKMDLGENSGASELPSLHVHLSAAENTASKLAREQIILSSLRYRSMHVRHDNIRAAHEKTFSWIFKTSSTEVENGRPSVKYIEWLEQPHGGQGIYWIGGKAGSGKSTLIKFIASHPQTEAALRRWTTKSETLITASYFFWHAGTILQKSQEGLMQSLLYEVLRQCPEIMPEVTPTRWGASLVAEQDVWTRAELLETLLRLATQKALSAKFCFFIDGLDEYSGDHADLVHVLGQVAALSNVKICLSSRPWEIFKAAYDNNTDRRLYLQDLTRKDIELFTLAMLEESEEYRQEQAHDPRYSDLVRQITNKAQGVFLWVFLVVRSLVEGLRNGDSISILERRLEALPDELEQLFKRMIDEVEKVYKQKAAQTFQVVLAAQEPLPLMVYSFVHDDCPQDILHSKLHPSAVSEISRRQDRTRRQISAMSKGLLEVLSAPGSNTYGGFKDSGLVVVFLHRTARDFLMEHQANLLQNVGSNFQVHVSTCYALLAVLKFYPLAQRTPHGSAGELDMIDFKESLMENFMYHARQAEQETQQAQNALLEEMERVYLTFPPGYRRHRRFINFCVARNICLFVERQIIQFPSLIENSRSERSLLEWALMPIYDNPHRRPDLTAMVHLLLRYHANPNDRAWQSPTREATVWGEFLEFLLELGPNNGSFQTAEISKPVRRRRQDRNHQVQHLIPLLLDHGADPNASHQGKTLWGGFLSQSWEALKVAQPDIQPSLAFEIAKKFLAYGADPNLPFEDNRTIWEDFLAKMYHKWGPGVYHMRNRLPIYEMTEMLIVHGAKTDASITVLSHNPGPPFYEIDVINDFFEREEASRLEKIIQQAKVKRTTELKPRSKTSRLKRLFTKKR